MPVVTIAVDAMGGDHAPRAIVEGALRATARPAIRVLLVGATAVIRDELTRQGAAETESMVVVEAPDVVGMTEAPLAALRRKPRASVRVAVEQVARGAAQATFSAGHTGATLVAAHGVFGVLAGADRPALAVSIPTRAGAAILLDAGANMDCRPEHLEQFGVMGSAYAKVALKIDEPTVGLLSIGAEAGKGNDLIREAHARLEGAPVNFIGNLEARDLFTGRARVVVCDGFTGNIALKVGEGLVEAVEAMLREEFATEVISKVGATLIEPAFARFRQRVDYAEYGGAPLLGVSGLALVGHGHSSAVAVENGIVMAARLVEERVVGRLSAALTGRENR
jgi:glycerol-3-phosphate acyltransferase PlsX